MEMRGRGREGGRFNIHPYEMIAIKHNHGLVHRPSQILILQFVLTIIHGSRRVVKDLGASIM